MIRVLLGLALGGGLGALAGNAALQQLFGVNLEELWDRLDERGFVYVAVLALPILFLLLRGWAGHLIAAALVSGGVALTLKYYLEDDAPWGHVLTLAGIYSVVAIGVYRTLVSRALG